MMYWGSVILTIGLALLMWYAFIKFGWVIVVIEAMPVVGGLCFIVGLGLMLIGATR